MKWRLRFRRSQRYELARHSLSSAWRLCRTPAHVDRDVLTGGPTEFGKPPVKAARLTVSNGSVSAVLMSTPILLRSLRRRSHYLISWLDIRFHFCDVGADACKNFMHLRLLIGRQVDEFAAVI